MFICKQHNNNPFFPGLMMPICYPYKTTVSCEQPRTYMHSFTIRWFYSIPFRLGMQPQVPDSESATLGTVRDYLRSLFFSS